MTSLPIRVLPLTFLLLLCLVFFAAIQREISELQAKKASVDNDKRRNDMAKGEALRELNRIQSQMSSSLSRVRREDVDRAKQEAANLAKSRDDFNTNPRREEITKEIRVQEDRLKSISATIEQDNAVRKQLRHREKEQNEIDMLQKQVNQEYDHLAELLRDNSFLIQEQGENAPRVTQGDDPLPAVEVLHNNVRTKLADAQSEVERCGGAVGDAQRKVSEKQALLGNHRNRLQQLQHKRSLLLQDGGGVQKVKSVVKAIIRKDKDDIDPDRINADTSPSELLKYIAEQVNDYSSSDEKPEHITRIIKRLKKMVRNL